MKRYLILILAGIMVLASVVAGCAPDLPKEEGETFFAVGNYDGYSWGYWLVFENEDRTDIFWTPPDRVDKVQELCPHINITEVYIPKGYWTIKDVANTSFPDGTPFNDKQKKQAVEEYNWGFYSGFLQGSKDCLEGKPDRYLL